jgi:hypothetical protein
MFYASVGQENPDGGAQVPVFDYYLADRLGRTVAELETMPHTEYLGWRSFHAVRHQQDELAMKRASRG